MSLIASISKDPNVDTLITYKGATIEVAYTNHSIIGTLYVSQRNNTAGITSSTGYKSIPIENISSITNDSNGMLIVTIKEVAYNA